MLGERALQRVELAVDLGERLDRLDRGAVGLDGQQHAGLHGLAVQDDGAGAAVPRIAADVRSGQAAVVTDEMDEQAPRLDAELDELAVQLDGEAPLEQGLGRHRTASPSASSVARTAITSAR